jgi:cytochrome b pre-mRNA-processing protein 3
MSFARLKGLFVRNEGRAALEPLYNAAIAEARDPFWYLDGAVPDTIDGRFDMVGAVVSLLIMRLDAEGDVGKTPAVMLTEIFIDDMDGQLRQVGIGDIVVGKHIGRMLSALGGRLEVYGAALRGEADLKAALIRNVYRGEAPAEAAVTAVASRLEALAKSLAGQPFDALMAGQLRA